MANPLYNENSIYEHLKQEHITVHYEVWNLMNHHIRNDVNLISLGIGEYTFEPHWILKAASFVMKMLHKLSRQPGPEPYDLEEVFKKTLDRTKEIDRFLKKLHHATEEIQEKEQPERASSFKMQGV